MNTPTSEVLNLAADLLERREWTQGNPGMLVSESDPLCIMGAIGAAAGVTETLRWSTTETLYYQPAVERCPAHAAVVAHLGDRIEDVGSRILVEAEVQLWEWNDAPGRTAAEVIEVLRAAAAVEAAREDSLDRTRLMSLVAEAEANAS